MYCIHPFIQEEKLPYAFYVGDEELSVQLGAYMRQKNGGMRSLDILVHSPFVS
jgi:ribosome assembly protein 4